MMASILFYKRYRESLVVSSTLSAIASLLVLAHIVSMFYCGVINLESRFLGIPIYMDSLSMLLCIVVSILGLATAVYTPSYMKVYEKLGRGWLYGLLHNAFVFSMLMVVLSRNTLHFIIFWEIMTLSSYLLIIWEYEDENVCRIGWKYFVTMHIVSTIPLILGILLLGELYGDFDMLYLSRVASPNILLYLLFLLGFGGKAGIVPLHFWLPDAHPAAPSNASALLSGAMIKVAVYGLIRFTCFVLPPSTIVGYIVLLFGTFSLFIGTLYALKQTDGKRLLAYHSVGQMGYIWLGIGIGILFLSYKGIYTTFGVVALTAGLFHLLNHALFKGALFLSAGSILYRTGSRDLDKVSGLAKYMPITALSTLVAALSIAGVPPLNGFLSKWLIYQVSFLSGNPLVVFCGVIAFIISAATLASFIKFYTTAFGGLPSLTNIVEDHGVKEVPKGMLIGQLLLSIPCIIVGVAPWLVLPLLTNIGLKIVHIPVPTTNIVDTITWDYFYIVLRSPLIPESTTTYFAPLLLATILSIIVACMITVLREKTVVSEPWICGEDAPLSSVKMTAKHYYVAFEEHIGVLYHIGNILYHNVSTSLRFLVLAYESIALGLVRIAGIFPRIIYKIASLYKHYIRSDIYLDEAMVLPWISFVKKITLILVRKNRLNTMLVLAVFYLAILCLVGLIMIAITYLGW